MKLSVVIPAYNEESVIGRSLDALMAQRDGIAEVIVVDNNCTDGTIDEVSARQNGPIPLTIVRESRSGLIAARNAGIAVAGGDVIARIDADTIVEPGWAQAIVAFFDSASDDYAAGVGPFEQYDMPLQGVHRLLLRLAAPGEEITGGAHETGELFGANMVIRRSAWETIFSDLHDEPGIWEDLDIALALQAAGLKIAFLDGMRAQISGRRMLSSRKTYWKYTAALPYTCRLHGNHKQARMAWIPATISRAFYILFWIPSRSFDPITRRHSVRRLFSAHEERIIP